MRCIPSFSRLGVLALTAVVVFGSAAAHAESADRSQSIHADAARGEVNSKTGDYVLDGDVHITQGTLSIVADHAVMRQSKDGRQTVNAMGHPITFRERMDNGTDWLQGTSDSVDYDTATGDVHMVGHAELKRGGDDLTGNTITYNTATEQSHSDGGVQPGAPGKPGTPGRVHIVLQPRRQGAVAPSQPATVPTKP